MSRKYGLAFVGNPYRTVCLVPVGDDGKPVLNRHKKWTGKWDAKGEPVYRGTVMQADTYNPHSSGGSYSTGNFSMIDSTPRDWDDAQRHAMRCPPGNHIDGPISAEEALALMSC